MSNMTHLRETDICQTCHQTAPIVASNRFPGLCQRCYGRAHSRDYQRRKGQRPRADFWQEHENEIIRRRYASASRKELTAALPGRSWKAIKHQALLIGVQRDLHAQYAAQIADEPARSNDYWRAWALMRKDAPTHPAIAELIAAERRILRTL